MPDNKKFRIKALAIENTMISKVTKYIKKGSETTLRLFSERFKRNEELIKTYKRKGQNKATMKAKKTCNVTHDSQAYTNECFHSDNEQDKLTCTEKESGHSLVLFSDADSVLENLKTTSVTENLNEITGNKYKLSDSSDKSFENKVGATEKDNDVSIKETEEYMLKSEVSKIKDEISENKDIVFENENQVSEKLDEYPENKIKAPEKEVEEFLIENEVSKHVKVIAKTEKGSEDKIDGSELKTGSTVKIEKVSEKVYRACEKRNEAFENDDKVSEGEDFGKADEASDNDNNVYMNADELSKDSGEDVQKEDKESENKYETSKNNDDAAVNKDNASEKEYETLKKITELHETKNIANENKYETFENTYVTDLIVVEESENSYIAFQNKVASCENIDKATKNDNEIPEDVDKNDAMKNKDEEYDYEMSKNIDEEKFHLKLQTNGLSKDLSEKKQLANLNTLTFDKDVMHFFNVPESTYFPVQWSSLLAKLSREIILDQEGLKYSDKFGSSVITVRDILSSDIFKKLNDKEIEIRLKLISLINTSHKTESFLKDTDNMNEGLENFIDEIKRISCMDSTEPSMSNETKNIKDFRNSITSSDLPLLVLQEKIFNHVCLHNCDDGMQSMKMFLNLVEFLYEPSDVFSLFGDNDSVNKGFLDLKCIELEDYCDLLILQYKNMGNGEQQTNYRLVVVTAEVFEDAMRQYQIEQYETTFTNYFPKNCRMFLHIPVYKGGFINRRDKKDGRARFEEKKRSK